MSVGYLFLGIGNLQCGHGLQAVETQWKSDGSRNLMPILQCGHGLQAVETAFA